MNKESTRLSYLLQRFNARTASQDELAELAGLLNNPEAEKTLQQYWERVPEQDQFFGEATSQQLLSTILEQRHKPASIRPLRRRVTWLAAAAILFLLIVGAWLYRPTSAERQDLPKVLATTSSVIVPGSNKAVLVLGDGTKILLDSARNGHLAAEGNATVTKTDGQVSYLNQQQAAAGQALSYNTLFTPKGGQYQVVLSDGTKVWMNAASSLRYPATFSGKDRVVTLTGEAYFEVAKDLSKPFKVVLNGMEVQVLGTHFNVMAYQNEAAIKTTLLEGAVNINSDKQVVRLAPGQQAQRSAGGLVRVVQDIDMEETMAWKNGYFQFNHDGLDVVMQQIERWYDVQVSFEGKMPERKFGGKISRSSNISDVLKVLELSKVAFRIEGKKIIVTNR
jgi:ferric-dicitrate binding protein FerR (iron transport regulator)